MIPVRIPFANFTKILIHRLNHLQAIAAAAFESPVTLKPK